MVADDGLTITDLALPSGQAVVFGTSPAAREECV
jgi:hypothetical protein